MYGSGRSSPGTDRQLVQHCCLQCSEARLDGPPASVWSHMQQSSQGHLPHFKDVLAPDLSIYDFGMMPLLSCFSKCPKLCETPAATALAPPAPQRSHVVSASCCWPSSCCTCIPLSHAPPKRYCPFPLLHQCCQLYACTDHREIMESVLLHTGRGHWHAWA
eukprot:jgi/Ulvmu1/573/UM001_0581.1